MQSTNLIIRADASATIGTGHIMRCIALAQAWQDQGGKVVFLLAHKPSVLENKLRSQGIEVSYLSVEAGSDEDAYQTVDFIRQFAAQWVVVDGYHFGTEYQKIIKDSGTRLLFIDDFGHADHYYADLVLNQNISANQELYINREPYTKLLLGTEYTLLRREFWQWRDWQREVNPIASKILITLGGSDPDNVTLKVIQALNLLNKDKLETIVVIGGSNPHYECLQREVTDASLAISLQRNVSNMPELMAWADLAIAAGGSTNWELAFMGLPSLVITIADNQQAIAVELDRQGVIINLGWHQDVTIEQISLVLRELIGDRHKREDMSKKGRKLVDGNGASRVASQKC
ncbi:MULTISPECIES: UDP-2,4-diacetamido-2,4,6-trideoxy-beta-L-altropyranose hydrolase [Pseudanabaena]|jgi:UDP-2,4-diacetamido-2,4,6-trideoxy-beta-L-altropyranose hydrolase|uniref:UDP-2,4-diacetamido-2,4, 6-trideoxy-beta-L-altropyranose hydrolase n=1 Tax=Pseudanabaena TaxID=1152 RepID=UPI002479D117|nr:MULTISPECIES: UDP-2,4-diacetamido-2,4,6-trideoxy-beta-L-altropyranose hydrolase [Pseudanabaena]MEA5487703.1 UDP-2,4-diacetamido-2,4,6-trideoxy-beta-L-altropyranose hydrolase [Pseudanabaena sp. CCNP1317]WGS70828.1 UDP-2,4-diacetamido-2,4,6-trideoxy-beta-L-altropyranose hydrolase [Pseudanabaena galeata CCNP1313]